MTTKKENQRPSVGRAAYSVDEFCYRNDIGRTTVYVEMNAGRLKFLKVGARRKITPQQETDWHKLLAARADAA